MWFGSRCVTFTGESHTLKGTECQDYSGYVCGEDFSASIVADGHGSKIRSAIGAKIAVEVAADVIRDLAKDIPVLRQMMVDDESGEFETIKKTISEIWLERVFSYHLKHRLNEEEVAEVGVLSTSHDVFSIYGTTLILAFLSKDLFFSVQMGDGGCVLVYQNGNAKTIDSNIDGMCRDNQTTSLSDPHSYRLMHHFVATEKDRIPEAVAVFTDGFEIEDEADVAVSIAKIFSLMGDDGEWYDEICPEIESRTHRYKQDDTSFAISYRGDTDFIELYNNLFGEEYPFYSYEPAPNDTIIRISSNGRIDSSSKKIIEDVKETDVDGNVCIGTYSNGSMESETIAESEMPKDSWDTYAGIYENMMDIPLDSEFTSRLFANIILHLKKKNNHDLREVCIDLEEILVRVESLIERNKSVAEDIQDPNNLYRLLNLHEIESDTCIPTTSSGSKYAQIVNNSGNSWVEKRLMGAEGPHGNGREWQLLYNGAFRDGKRNGLGILYRPDGSEYHGIFINGMMDDSRGEIYSDGNLVFLGSFKNNLREGHGYEFHTSKHIPLEDQYIKSCQYQNDVENGECSIYRRIKNTGEESTETAIMFYECGSIKVPAIDNKVWHKTFKGNVIDGKKNGLGVELNKFTLYVGEFKDDVHHGNGVLYEVSPSFDIDKDYSKLPIINSGEFKNGIFLGDDLL